jgi:hypothetical protein
MSCEMLILLASAPVENIKLDGDTECVCMHHASYGQQV